MKKNLLAIAVGAALASPMMMPGAALADGPKVYGKVNVSLENMNYDPAPASPNNDDEWELQSNACLLYTSPSPRDKRQSRMPSSA